MRSEDLRTIRETAIEAVREFVKHGAKPIAWENGRLSPMVVLDLLNYIDELEERAAEKDGDR